MTRQHRIRIIGQPKAQIDLDLLAQALLLVAQQAADERLDTDGEQSGQESA